MTREEKQKAIDALKISVPVMAMTPEEFNDYIQTLNKIMDWLEQEPILDKLRDEIKAMSGDVETISDVLDVIDKYKAESEDKIWQT